jgi:hypothetical protein
MNVSVRLFIGYFLIVGLAAWFVLNIFMHEAEPGIRQATEETLVDTAHVLAELAAPELIASGRWPTAASPGRWRRRASVRRRQASGECKRTASTFASTSPTTRGGWSSIPRRWPWAPIIRNGATWRACSRANTARAARASRPATPVRR